MVTLISVAGVDWETLSALIVTVVGFGLVLFLPLWLLRGGLTGFGEPALRRCFEGIRLHQTPEQGDVRFRYHTYRGLRLWVVQQEHRVIAPPEDAVILLRRLLRYNLSWGMLSAGALLVPPLALGNYYAQKRWVRRQAQAPDAG